MKYYNDEIIKYNSQIYEKYDRNLNLGFFNFPHVIVIDFDKNYCKEKIQANSYEEYAKLYRKCVINSSNKELIDLSSYYVSFINITNLNQEVISIIKKQIEIFNPNLVIILGKTAKNILLSEEAEFNKLYEIDNILYYPILNISKEDRNTLNEICKKKCIIKITNQKIYYRDIDGKKKWYSNPAQKYFFVPDKNGEYISVFYDKLKKVYNNNESSNTTFEKHLTKADIFLYENLDIKYSKHYKFCTIDIETNFCNTPLNPEKEIIAISTCNSMGDLYNIFVYNPNNQKINYEEFKNIKILNFTSEKEMIESFFKMLSVIDFDIIIGWFSNKFDVPYLFYRAKVLGIDLNKYLENINILEDNISCDSLYFLDAKDYIHNFTNTIISSIPISMSLNSISELVLHDKKEDVMPSEIPSIWQNNINLLIKYNIKDVYLTHNIIITVRIIDYITLRLNIVNGNLDRIIHNSVVIEMLLHKKYFSKYKFPSKSKNNNNFEEIEGGLVLNPVKGRYKNVVVYDFSSMYPSIIMTFNISPEMSKNISHNPDLNENIIIDNVKFSTHTTGMFPELEIELLQLRAKYKEEMKKYDINDIKFRYYNVLQSLVKQVANSLYGATGYKNFFLYNPLISKSITYIGRNLLLYVKNFVESLGYKVIYGDTDSIFVKFPDNLDNNIINLALDIEKKINSSLYDFVRKYIKDEEYIKSHMRLKVSLGYIFSSFFLTDAKKRYFGQVIYYDGKTINKFHTMGFEIKRHDTPIFFVDIYFNIYNYILDNNIIELAKYIKSLYKTIRETPTENLTITIKLAKDIEEYKNNNEYVSAIKKSKNKIAKGDYVSFIYTKTGLQLYEKNIKKESIDYEKYITKFVLNKIKIIDEDVYNNLLPLLGNF
ncbi:DNA-directed DNA polymerase [Desulfurella sp.]|uniref:DNA-directed DNA polymerase n=1 Tax=Desulfurella sp. TaxID=1962857 RepID=UPI0025BAA620|nr:DNA-directed DNA polymerase [Desulfurella sp.]